jgi:hypothetical protein
MRLASKCNHSKGRNHNYRKGRAIFRAVGAAIKRYSIQSERFPGKMEHSMRVSPGKKDWHWTAFTNHLFSSKW